MIAPDNTALRMIGTIMSRCESPVALHVNTGPLWSEVAKGGIILQKLVNTLLDTKIRAMRLTEPLWCICVGSVTIC